MDTMSRRFGFPWLSWRTMVSRIILVSVAELTGIQRVRGLWGYRFFVGRVARSKCERARARPGEGNPSRESPPPHFVLLNWCVPYSRAVRGPSSGPPYPLDILSCGGGP